MVAVKGENRRHTHMLSECDLLGVHSCGLLPSNPFTSLETRAHIPVPVLSCYCCDWAGNAQVCVLVMSRCLVCIKDRRKDTH